MRILHLLVRGPAGAPLTSPAYRSVRAGGSAAAKRIEIIERYVRDNLSKQIRQADIALQLGLSAPAFSRFFKGATGNTFIRHVNQLRIHEACSRLASSTDTVTKIAMACGYNNLSNFNRQFAALEGINPTEYRRLVNERNGRHRLFSANSASQSGKPLCPQTASAEEPGRCPIIQEKVATNQ